MPLPDGYTVRHPAEADLAGAQAVLDAAESADTGEPRRHEHDFATEWKDPKCHPETDWWVAASPDGAVAAAGWIWPQTAGEVTADHYVHPEHRGRGLGETMLDTIEARVAELPPRKPDGAARRLVVWCEDSDAGRRASLDRRGFVAVRQYFEMEIGLSRDLAAPTWPPGIGSRGFRSGEDDEVVHRAGEEAFAEHHLFEPCDYDEWRLLRIDAPDSDVTLWWLAWDGEELVGYVIPNASDRGAVISDLAVRKPWRGQGIGHALLLAAFATLRDRGQTAARLYVDAQNVTSAVRVYEAAGMHVSRRFDVMERPLG